MNNYTPPYSSAVAGVSCIADDSIISIMFLLLLLCIVYIILCTIGTSLSQLGCRKLPTLRYTCGHVHCTRRGAGSEGTRKRDYCTNKNTKKNCLRLLSNGFRVDGPRRRRFGAAREGAFAIAPEIGLKIPADARAINIILRVYTYKRYNIQQVINIYIYARRLPKRSYIM